MKTRLAYLRRFRVYSARLGILPSVGWDRVELGCLELLDGFVAEDSGFRSTGAVGGLLPGVSA